MNELKLFRSAKPIHFILWQHAICPPLHEQKWLACNSPLLVSPHLTISRIFMEVHLKMRKHISESCIADQKLDGRELIKLMSSPHLDRLSKTYPGWEQLDVVPLWRPIAGKHETAPLASIQRAAPEHSHHETQHLQCWRLQQKNQDTDRRNTLSALSCGLSPTATVKANWQSSSRKLRAVLVVTPLVNPE